MTKKNKKFKNCVAFFDFDNTITKIDVLDDMLERFSQDDKWVRLEEEWKSGRIGSRQCLDGQMRGIRISRERLDKYLGTVELDPSFKKLLNFCDTKKIKKVILSDNFDYILKGILKNNGIDGLDIYCNSLKMSKGVLTPEFPYNYQKRGKRGKCAHCKTKNLMANVGADSMPIYIGDGLSDVCPSKKAKLVFAKSTLKRHLDASKTPYVPFDDLNDVYEYLKKEIL